MAQIMASTSSTSPDSSCMPPGTTRAMPSVTTLTLGCVRDCRYPGAGVILRQPRGKSGISFLQSTSSPPSMARMYSTTCERANACTGLSLRI